MADRSMKGWFGFWTTVGTIFYFLDFLGPLWTIFQYGNIWFWVLIGVMSFPLAGYLSNYRRHWVFAVLTFSVLVLLLHFLGGNQLLTAIQENRELAIKYITYYLGFALIWMFIRWWRFGAKNVRRYKAIRREFLDQKGYEQNDLDNRDEVMREFASYVETNSYRFGLELIPDPAEHVAQIVVSGVFWPWSMAYTVLDDPVRRLIKVLYRNFFREMFQWISRFAFRDVRDEIERMNRINT